MMALLFIYRLFLPTVPSVLSWVHGRALNHRKSAAASSTSRSFLWRSLAAHWVKAKGTYTWYSAYSWIITSEVLRYGTCSQGILPYLSPAHPYVHQQSE